MAKKKRCTKGLVKSGPRKGKCRKVCPKNCKTLGKARRAAPKRKVSGRRRADCEKWGYSIRLGRCRKGPGRRRVSASGIFDRGAPQVVRVRDIPGTAIPASSSMILYGRR